MNGSLRRMFLKVPYISVVFFVLFLAGVSINIFCVLYIAPIIRRLGYELFKRYYLWVNTLQIVVISFYIYTILLMSYNLVVAFRSTAIVTLVRSSRIYCLDSGVVQKILYFINHVTLFATLALTLLVTVVVFVVITLEQLCIKGSKVPQTIPLDPYKVGYNPGELGEYLDLREFTPLIHLRNNETQYLYFKDNKLKQLCDDFVFPLYPINLILFAASVLTIYAMFNMIITFSFNVSRNITKKKLQELYFLNANELSQLNPK